ncbi:S1 RNA-binding domain-containing protein [Escherichia coli]
MLIAATDGEKAKHAIRRIEEITAEIEAGRVYTGKVTRIVDFGVFVAIGGGKEKVWSTSLKSLTNALRK